MTKFRYTDWTTVKTNISNARMTTLGDLTQYQQYVATFTQEEALQGATWQAAKEYINLTTPLAKGLANTLTDVGVVLDNYLTDFETTVNQTGKDLDSDKLRSLQKDLANIRAMKKATVAAVAKSHINDHLPGGEMNPYSGGVSTTAFDHNISSDTKKIKILDLYDDFEGRHTTDYTTIISALDSIKIGVQALNNPKNFNTTTGEFNPTNLNNAEWYQNLTNYNATKRDPAIDVKIIQTPIYGAAGNVVGYDKQYEVYIDGQLNPEAGKKLIELENKEGLKFVSGILGITDFLEAISGKDPFTGEKVTSQERAKAILWTVVLAVPVGKAAGALKDISNGARLDKAALGSMKNYTVPEAAQGLLDEYGLTIDDFNKLNAKQLKNAKEIALLKAFREKIPGPGSDTQLRKVIPTEYVDSMITNPKYGTISGFMTDKSYVQGITGINDVIESSRLDYKGSLLNKNGNYAYVDFTSQDTYILDTPNSPVFGGDKLEGWPFTGTGFTAGRNRTIVPEWETFSDKTLTPKSGSQIHEVINGQDTVVAEWVEDPFKKIKGWKDLR